MKTFITIIPIAGTILYFIYLFLTTASFYRNRRRVPKDLQYPKVSVLKPVKGADNGFEANIVSFYEQNYPDFEMLFALETPEDEATPVIEAVAAKYPAIRTRLVFTGTKKDKNPKIDNLDALEKIAEGTLLWVADANIRIDQGTLKKLSEEYILKDSKMVFSPIRGGRIDSPGSLIESNYLGLYVSGNILGSWMMFRHQLTVGKSILLEKETLRREFGGFRFFINYLAEDYMMGKHYTDRKLGISTNQVWVNNHNASGSVKAFRGRVIRWSVMRHKINRTAAVIETMFMNPILFSLIAAIAGVIPLELFLTISAAKIATESLAYVFMNNFRFTKLLMVPFTTLLKDLILFEAAIRPFFTGSVNWRGRKIRIVRYSEIKYSPSGLE